MNNKKTIFKATENIESELVKTEISYRIFKDSVNDLFEYAEPSGNCTFDFLSKVFKNVKKNKNDLDETIQSVVDNLYTIKGAISHE